VTLTTHIPFHAATRVEKPRRNKITGKTLQARPALLNVRRMSVTIPAMMRNMPSPRAKMTRGLLPLQIAWRTKLGWACWRKEYSTLLITSLKADGWVVCSSALRSARRSRPEMLSSRGEPPAMYIVRMRDISSRYG
jgi:hypothetical protein